MERAFDELVTERCGEGYVERDWLRARIEGALAKPDVGIVLVTAEPGAGKTSLIAGLAKAHPRWLRYFIGAENRGAVATGDLVSLLSSLGHQLANQRPELFEPSALEVTVRQRVGNIEEQGSATGIRIEDLRVSPFYRTARLAVEQHVGRLGGSLIGVEVGTAHVEPRLLEAENLAHLALFGPAAVLEDTDAHSPGIVVLIDALDEASRTDRDTELLEWLATGRRLPGNVKIVVTSRPQSALGLLRSGRRDELAEIVLEPGDRHVADDLVSYTETALADGDVVREAQNRGLFPDQFLRYAARRANGNFLYLATYLRALTDAIASGDSELIDRIFALEDVPQTLSGLYGFFIELARVEIDRLGLFDIRDPTSTADKFTTAWEGVGQPVLGVLTVTREPVTEAQLIEFSGVRVWERSVRNVLARLRWLLYWRDGRVALFHASVGEFLTGATARTEHPDCWLDSTEWHERISMHYRGSAATWNEVEWPNVDRYGLKHLPEHVLNSSPRVSRQAVGLICPGLLRAMVREFGSAPHFLKTVDLVAHHTAGTESPEDGVPTMMYLLTVRMEAARASSALPPKVLGLMARMGRLNAALEHTAALEPSVHQFAAMAEIWRCANPGPRDPSRDDLTELLVETALTLPEDRRPWPYRSEERRNAIQTAARVLAANDLDRALRLWKHGQSDTDATKTGADHEEPDVLYRAAAASEPDTNKACEQIARIRGDRWQDYLNLAERASAEEAPTLMSMAEESLATARTAARIEGFSRLATAWSKHDPATSRRMLAAVRAEVLDADEEEVREERSDSRKYDDFANFLTDVAAHLLEVDSTTARFLLARLDLSILGPHDACLNGASLWMRLGYPKRAHALVDRYSLSTSAAWRAFKVSRALGEQNRQIALRQIDHIHADIPAQQAGEEPIDASGREHELASVVKLLAEYDLDRAAQMVRGLRRVQWQDHTSLVRFTHADLSASDSGRRFDDEDRYSMLAELAHIHLDRGETAQAVSLLEEITDRFDFGAAPESDEAELNVSHLFLPDSAPVPSTPSGRTMAEGMLRLAAMEDLTRQWTTNVKQHFFRNPADIIRAAPHTPHSFAATVRTLAERLWPQSPTTALAAIRAIANPEERAIGLARLHRAAHRPDTSHGPEAEALSRELDRTLNTAPRYRWNVPDAEELELDRDPIAYIRPDHRVLFELAATAQGCRLQDQKAVQRLTYLSHVHLMTLGEWASATYAAIQLGELPALRSFQQGFKDLHSTTLHPSWRPELREPVADCARVAAAFHEYRISQAIPGHRTAAHNLRPSSPVYAAAADLLRSAPGAPLAPGFVQRLRSMIIDGPLPAAAGLVAFAADLMPEHEQTLRELSSEIITASRNVSAARRLDTLVILAASQLLGSSVDPVALIHDAEVCTTESKSQSHIPGQAVATLFPILLVQNPEVAQLALYTAGWNRAMAMLEHGADVLIGLMGPDVIRALCSSVYRGLTFVLPSSDANFGVHLEQLLSSIPA